MTPVEELHKTVWQILGEIRQEQIATPNDEWIIIDTKADTRERAVRLLAKVGSIKALDYNPLISSFKALQKFSGVYSKSTAYKIEPMQPRFDEVCNVYDKTFDHTYNAQEIQQLTDKIQSLSSIQKITEQKIELSIADKKKLFILEKLKEEWDLTPKTDDEPVMFQTGMKAHLRLAGETTISHQKFSSWMRECGISDWYELKNIFEILKQEGLISKFQNLNEAM